MTAQAVRCHPGAVGSCAASGGVGRGQEEEAQPGAGDPGTRGPEGCTSASRAWRLGLASLHRAGFFLAGTGVSEASPALCDRVPCRGCPRSSPGEGGQD